jgi:hypothetical protein
MAPTARSACTRVESRKHLYASSRHRGSCLSFIGQGRGWLAKSLGTAARTGANRRLKPCTAHYLSLIIDSFRSNGDYVQRIDLGSHLILITQRVRQFAERLLALEAAANAQRSQPASFRFSVCERLRVTLATFAGKAGFRALASRSLILAKAQAPRLASLKIDSEGCVEGFDLTQPPLSEEELAAGEIVFVACMVHLLRTFLGESLMLRLIHDVWPEASFTNTGSEETTV